MSRFKSQVLFALSVSALSMACSSSKTDTANGASGPGKDPATPTCNPNDPDIPCVVGKTEPCEDFHTSADFADDDKLCMKPPVDGYQLHVGPANYDDPAELNHELYSLGMELPDQVDQALSRWFKPRNTV